MKNINYFTENFGHDIYKSYNENANTKTKRQNYKIGDFVNLRVYNAEIKYDLIYKFNNFWYEKQDYNSTMSSNKIYFPTIASTYTSNTFYINDIYNKFGYKNKKETSINPLKSLSLKYKEYEIDEIKYLECYHNNKKIFSYNSSTEMFFDIFNFVSINEKSDYPKINKFNIIDTTKPNITQRLLNNDFGFVHALIVDKKKENFDSYSYNKYKMLYNEKLFYIDEHAIINKL